MLADAAKPIALTFRLLWRFWPQLAALLLACVITGDLLLQLAAHAAYLNHMAGLALLTLVALAQLVVTVAMFQVLRPGLPAIRAAQAKAAGKTGASGQEQPQSVRFVRLVTVALLPFFAYYAAWGFLGDIVRRYSRLALDIAPFGEGQDVLDVLDSRWLILSVVVSWLIRRFAKAMQAKEGARAFWQIVVVVCETNWIFVGLFVISRWQYTVLEWIVSRRAFSFLQAAADGIAAIATPSTAAPMVPVETTAASPATTLTGLFFYMLVPLIWLVMAALVYGYDVRDQAGLLRVHQRLERIGARYLAIPKFLRDFVEHFIGGYRSRYLPIANGVRLTLGSGVVLIVMLIVGYRLIDWAAAWTWLGAARLIGPHELDTWQVIGQGLTLLFGSPFQDSSTGLLIEPLRICFLAAMLETAFSPPARSPARPVPAKA